MKTKNNYQQVLHIYLKRREARKAGRYRALGKDSVKKLTLKIGSCRSAIKTIEKNESRVKELAEKVEKYFGFSIYKSVYTQTKIYRQARKFLYRLGTEAGIQRRYLMQYTGAKNKDAVSSSRMRIIRNKEQNELYKRFIKYIEDDNN